MAFLPLRLQSMFCVCNRGVTAVKKETLEYLCGDRNAVKDEFIISRETTGAAELVRVSHPEMEEPIYALWQTTKRRKKEGSRPKHTGGKKPYVILLYENKINLSLEASGLLLKIIQGGCIEWHTGRLIRKRDKRTMNVNMMMKEFNLGRLKLNRLMLELTTKGALNYDKSSRAYFIARDLVKKGGVLRENQIREGFHSGEDRGTPGVVYPGEQPCDRVGKCVSPTV